MRCLSSSLPWRCWSALLEVWTWYEVRLHAAQGRPLFRGFRSHPRRRQVSLQLPFVVVAERYDRDRESPEKKKINLEISIFDRDIATFL